MTAKKTKEVRVAQFTIIGESVLEEGTNINDVLHTLRHAVELLQGLGSAKATVDIPNFRMEIK